MKPLPLAPKAIEPHIATLFGTARSRALFDDRVIPTLGPLGDPGWRAFMRATLSRLPNESCRTLARFFIIGDEVSEQTLAPALGGAEVLAAFHRANLAEPAGESLWRCPVVVLPIGGVLAASDPIEDPGTEDVPDNYILPVGRTTLYVDDLTVRVPCNLAVDLGCGQGYHATRSLTHAKRCIATDINPRALEFARANAALNNAEDRIDFRLGSFFEPLHDVVGQVDLLACNPPFVIQPGAHTVGAISAMEGDDLLEHLALNAPRMLSANGWASFIGLWEVRAGHDWPSRVAAWLEGSGCDAIVLHFHTFRAEEYVAQMIAPDKHAETEPAWRDLCARRNIAGITLGGVILHKRQGSNWFRAIPTLINQRTGSGSAQLLAYFNTQTALASLSSPADLLSCTLRLAGGWRFDPTLAPPRSPPAGGTPGLALPLRYLAHYESLLPAFDGLAPARVVLERLYAERRITVAPDDPQAIAMLASLAATGCLDIVSP